MKGTKPMPAVAAALALILALMLALGALSAGCTGGRAPGPGGRPAGTSMAGPGSAGPGSAGEAPDGRNGSGTTGTGATGNGAPDSRAPGADTGPAVPGAESEVGPAWQDPGPVDVTLPESPDAPEVWAHVPAGQAAVQISFPRPMDRAGVEQAWLARLAGLQPGFRWKSDTELWLTLQAAALTQVTLTLDGLPAAGGAPWAGTGALELLAVPPARVLRVPPDGGAPSPLAAIDGLGLVGGLPSPDGRYLLAVADFRATAGDYYQLWLVELATGRRMALGPWRHFSDISQEEWLPDSSGVVRLAGAGVRRYGVDGTVATLLSGQGRYLHGMALAPRSGRIAVFVSTFGDPEIHLLLIPAGGGPPEDLGVLERAQEVSPDGAFPYQQVFAQWTESECCVAVAGLNGVRVIWDLERGIRTPVAAGDTLRSERQPGGRFWLVTRAGTGPESDLQVLLDGDGRRVLDLDRAGWQWGPGGDLWRTEVDPATYDLTVQRLAPTRTAQPLAVLRGTVLGPLPGGGLLLLEWQW